MCLSARHFALSPRNRLWLLGAGRTIYGKGNRYLLNCRMHKDRGSGSRPGVQDHGPCSAMSCQPRALGSSVGTLAMAALGNRMFVQLWQQNVNSVPFVCVSSARIQNRLWLPLRRRARSPPKARPLGQCVEHTRYHPTGDKVVEACAHHFWSLIGKGCSWGTATPWLSALPGT